MDELQSVFSDSSLQQNTGIPGTSPVNPLISPLTQSKGGALENLTLPLSLLQPSLLNDATVLSGKAAIALSSELQLVRPSDTATTDSLTGKPDSEALVGSTVGEIAPPPVPSADTAIPSFSVITEKNIIVNGVGDFDGLPSDLTDDALIYAKNGFLFTGLMTLPVNRDASGNPILNNGKQVLVNNAVTVSAGYTFSSAILNPYANLVPPPVIDPLTITVPAYSDLKQQEYDRRIPAGTNTVSYNIQQNPITTAAQWVQKFPEGGTATQPKVVRVTGGTLTIPANTAISNTVIILDSGNLVLAPSGGQTLNNVMLITNAGSVNLNGISSTNLSVFAATSLTMAIAARFSGSTVLANGSAASNITFAGATSTTNASDTLKVVAQGNISYSGVVNTRGQFLTAKAFTATGSSTIYGSIKAKGDITFNAFGAVVAIPPTNLDTTAPMLSADLTTDTAPDNTTNADRITANPAIGGSVMDAGTITEFKAGFGNIPVANYVNVLADRQADGSFSFSRTRLEQINGGTLPDGAYTLNLQAKDQAGNLVSFALTFTLDSTNATPTVTLVPSSDTGSSNSDRITNIKTPTLSGKAEADSVVTLSSGTQALGTATANATGDWLLTVTPLNDGTYSLTATSTDAAGNVSGTATPLQVIIDNATPQFTLTTPTDTPIRPGSNLTGSTDGTGSLVTALTYRFDSSSEIAIALDSSGGFNQAIDLTGITPGNHVLTVTLTDAAGNTSVNPYSVTVNLDITPPVVTAQLVNDTAVGTTNSDRVTSDPGIIGNVSDLGQISQLELSFGDTFLDITPDLQTNGTFTLNRSRLELLKGSKLADGAYILSLRATDASGNVSVPVPLSFLLDTTAPLFPSFQLAAAFDTSPVGDRRTISAQVTLVGQAEANQTVTLLGTELTTQTDAAGQFQFTSVALTQGVNILNAQAVDAAGNTKTFSTAITRMSKRDMVLDWNAITLQAIKTSSSNPPKSSRVLGMVQAAVYDAANAVDGTHEVYYSAATAPYGTSAEAAVAAAAHGVLVSLYPDQATNLDVEYTSALATIPDGIGKTQGVTLGEQVAQDILNWRSTDGSDASSGYTPGTAPGQWQPTSAASALLPEWGNVTPFALTSGSQFRPSGSPSLTSPQYTMDFNQVKELGRVDSTTRTAEQTEIAQFWADGAGTETPAGHWNAIAADVAIAQGLTLVQEARLFALLNVGLADAGIAAWDAKYTYDFWRPVTAIRGAESDGNAATAEDDT